MFPRYEERYNRSNKKINTIRKERYRYDSKKDYSYDKKKDYSIESIRFKSNETKALRTRLHPKTEEKKIKKKKDRRGFWGFGWG